MNSHLCHTSARCDLNQPIKRLDKREDQATVHNVRQMKDGIDPLVKSDHRFRGFTKDEQGHRHGVYRLIGTVIWIEEL